MKQVSSVEKVETSVNRFSVETTETTPTGGSCVNIDTHGINSYVPNEAHASFHGNDGSSALTL